MVVCSEPGGRFPLPLLPPSLPVQGGEVGGSLETVLNASGAEVILVSQCLHRAAFY